MVLPAEGQPQRLTNNGGYPTVVTKYAQTVPTLTVPYNTTNAAIYVGGSLLQGAIVVTSRQPSRTIGYAPANLTAATRPFKCWFLAQPTATSGPAVGVDTLARTPTNNLIHPDFRAATASTIPIVLQGTDDLTFSALQINPVAMQWGSSSSFGTMAEHFGVDHDDNVYLWADSATATTPSSTNSTVFTVSFSLTVGQSSAVGTVSTLSVTTNLWATRWSAEKSEEAVSFTVPLNWTVTATSTGAFTTGTGGNPDMVNDPGITPYALNTYTTVLSLNVTVPGYYTLRTTDFIVTPVSIAAADGAAGLRLTNLSVSLSGSRPGAGISWLTAPEMLSQPLLYGCSRTTAAACLMSNRTAEMYRGGNITAVACKDEQSFLDMLCTPNRLTDRAALRPAGFTGDLAKGCYHWLRPGLDDARTAQYVNVIGMPLYRLDHESTVSIAMLTSTTTSDQTIALYFDLHIESEVTNSQSYGRQVVPKMTTNDFESTLIASADWPIWHENPTHVLDYLKKIGAASWTAFKFLAPHLITAASAAASGATPIGAIRAVLQGLL